MDLMKDGGRFNLVFSCQLAQESYRQEKGLNLEVAAMAMENKHAMRKKKLEVFEILEEAIRIPCENINFIFFEVITSFSLFCLLVHYEILLQKTLFETSEIVRQPPGYLNYSWPIPIHITKKLNWEFSYKLIRLTLLYLVPLHILEFYSVLVTVYVASKIYAKKRSLTIKKMIQKPVQETGLTGTFMTSLYVLFVVNMHSAGVNMVGDKLLCSFEVLHI